VAEGGMRGLSFGGMSHGYMLKDMQQIAHDNTISYAAPRGLLGEINKNTRNKIKYLEKKDLNWE
jgi:hypothetical protein